MYDQVIDYKSGIRIPAAVGLLLRRVVVMGLVLGLLLGSQKIGLVRAEALAEEEMTISDPLLELGQQVQHYIQSLVSELSIGGEMTITEGKVIEPAVLPNTAVSDERLKVETEVSKDVLREGEEATVTVRLTNVSSGILSGINMRNSLGSGLIFIEEVGNKVKKGEDGDLAAFENEIIGEETMMFTYKVKAEKLEVKEGKSEAEPTVVRDVLQIAYGDEQPMFVEARVLVVPEGVVAGSVSSRFESKVEADRVSLKIPAGGMNDGVVVVKEQPLIDSEDGLGVRVRFDLDFWADSEETRDLKAQAEEKLSGGGKPIKDLDVKKELTKGENKFAKEYALAVKFEGIATLNELPIDQVPAVFVMDEASGVWVRQPIDTIDPDTNSVILHPDHFSTWGAGINGTFPTNGASIPLYDEPRISLFTGKMSTAFPIWTPAGRGLTPSVALAYNSGAVDGVLGDVQAPWVGNGWSLADVSISRKIMNGGCGTNCGSGSYGYEDKFLLNMNGTGYELIEDPTYPGRYLTSEKSTMLIQRHNMDLGNEKDATGSSPLNTTKEWWEVITENGTKYRFGWNPDSEQLAPMKGYSLPVGRNVVLKGANSASAWNYSAYPVSVLDNADGSLRMYYNGINSTGGYNIGIAGLYNDMIARPFGNFNPDVLEPERWPLDIPMQIVADSAASNCSYVITPENSGANDNLGMANIKFTASVTGSHYVYVRTIAGTGANQVKVWVDNETPYLWTVPTSTAFTWSKVPTYVTASLSAGTEHILHIKTVTDGVKLDSAIVSTNSNYTPLPNLSCNRPILSAGATGSWDVQVAGTEVVKVGNTYHMWYEGMDGSGVIKIGHATSSDGMNWAKDPTNPVLSGVSGTWEHQQRYPTVIYDTATSTFHMWYIGMNSAGNDSKVGHATSSDGSSWTRDTANNPLFGKGSPGSFDSTAISMPAVIKVGNQYLLFYVGSDGTYIKIGVAVSSSLSGPWTKPTQPIASIPAWSGTGMGMPMVLYDQATGKLKLWFYTNTNPLTTAYMYSMGVADTGQADNWNGAWTIPDKSTSAWNTLGYAGSAADVVAAKWSADRVTDINNNLMSYSYVEEQRTADSVTYDKASYVSKIRYNGSAASGKEKCDSATESCYEVQFITATRPAGTDDTVTTPTNWDNWQDKLLDKVEIHALGPSQDVILKTYDMSYTDVNLSDSAPSASWDTMVLSSIQASAANGGSTLYEPMVSYKYTNKKNRANSASTNEWTYPRMTIMENGTEGRSTISYTEEARPSTEYFSYKVTERRVDPDIGDGKYSLLHMDGTDASTAIIDSTGRRTWSAVNQAQIDTAQSKFGGSSVQFDGTTDYIEASSSADLDVGSGDFTMDFWIRVPSGAGAGQLMSLFNKRSSSAEWEYMYVGVTDGTTLRFYASSEGVSWDIADYLSFGTITANTWTHVAIARQGSSIRLFKDGVLGATVTTNQAIHFDDNKIRLGGDTDIFGFQGWMDEFRFTKGTALWTANFTPPTSADSVVAQSLRGTKITDYEYNENKTALIHGDGADASTVFADSSGRHYWEVVDNTQVDTAQSKFGGASIKFDGIGDYLSTPDNPDFDVQREDFTMDMWVRLASTTGYQFFVTKRPNNSYWRYFIVGNSGGTLYFWGTSNGSSWDIANGTSFGTISANTWTHVAVVRRGSAFMLFKDGILGATVNTWLPIFNDSSRFLIGGDTNAAVVNGWIDEFRFIKGKSLWTGNFTPPTAPHTTEVSPGPCFNSSTYGWCNSSGRGNFVGYADGKEISRDYDGVTILGQSKSYFNLDQRYAGNSIKSETLDATGSALAKSETDMGVFDWENASTYPAGVRLVYPKESRSYEYRSDTGMTLMSKTTNTYESMFGNLLTSKVASGSASTFYRRTDYSYLSNISNLTLLSGTAMPDVVDPTSFGYSRKITLNNGGSEQSNYEALLEVDTAALIAEGKMQADCDDIRFTKSDNISRFDYFIESGCNTATTQVWVKIPSLLSGNTEIVMHYGNTTASAGQLAWTAQNFILPFKASCPSGWSAYTNLNNNSFPRGSATPGGTGSGSHTHTMSGSTSGPSGGSGAWDPADNPAGGGTTSHYHNYSFPSSSVTLEPPYVDVIYCSKTGVPNTVNTDTIGMFETLPSGWSNLTAINTYFGRGNTTYGTTGGNLTHTHTYSGNTGAPVGTQNYQITDPHTYIPGPTHYHGTISGTTDVGSTNNTPPYREQIGATRNSSGTLVGGIIGMSDSASLPPMGWSQFSNLDGKFVKFNSSSGATGGNATHTHTYSGGSLGTGWPGSNSNPGGTPVMQQHTHTYSAGTTQSGSSLPKYLDVVFLQRKSDGTSKTYGGEEGYGSGADGAKTITTSASKCDVPAGDFSSALCKMAKITAAVSQGADTITVASTAGYAVGDEILIIQMTGTGAGNSETRAITQIISGTQLRIGTVTNNAYQSSGAQIARVPQFTDLTVNGRVNFVPVAAWDPVAGIGGVFYMRAKGTVMIQPNASMNVDGLGVSGGAGTVKIKTDKINRGYVSASGGAGAGGLLQMSGKNILNAGAIRANGGSGVSSVEVRIIGTPVSAVYLNSFVRSATTCDIDATPSACQAQNHVLSESYNAYDDTADSLGTKGRLTLTQARTLADATQTVDSEVDYDEYGKVALTVARSQYGTLGTLPTANENDRMSMTIYDSTYHMLPVTTIDPMGLTSTIKYDFQLGEFPLRLVRQAFGPNANLSDVNTSSRVVYDILGRVIESYNVGSTVANAKTIFPIIGAGTTLSAPYTMENQIWDDGLFDDDNDGATDSAKYRKTWAYFDGLGNTIRTVVPDQKPSWDYKRDVTITNNGSTLTNLDILVTLDTATLISGSKMDDQCHDIRFTDADGITALTFFLESGCNTSATKLWVRVPSVPNGNKTIYLSYGNQGAVSRSANYGYSDASLGDGADGALTPTGTFNLNSSTSGSRSYADGIAYKVDPATATISGTMVKLYDTPNGIAAGDEVLLIDLQGALGDTGDVGNHEFFEVASVNGSSKEITFNRSIARSFDGALANHKVVLQRVPNYTSVTLDSTDSITASAWDGLTPHISGAVAYYSGIVAFRATGTVTVGSGTTINVNNLGYRGGTTQGSVTQYAQQGEGRMGLGSTSTSAYNANDGGGGGGYNNNIDAKIGGGAGGGYGAAGSNGSITGAVSAAVGGSSYGDANLSQMMPGSGGGKGGCNFNGSPCGANGGDGGIGGGIIFVAANTLSNSGTIAANGQSSSTGSGGAGGGGGAGGSIFLAAGSMTLGTTTANAGTAGGGTWPGGNGAVGRIKTVNIVSTSIGSEGANAGKAPADMNLYTYADAGEREGLTVKSPLSYRVEVSSGSTMPIAYVAPDWTKLKYTRATTDVGGRNTSASVPGDQPGEWVTTYVTSDGRVSTTTNALGDCSMTIANDLGQVTDIRDYDGPCTGTPYSVKTYGMYNSVGQPTKIWDAQGNVITITFDKLGRKTQMMDPDLGTSMVDGYDRWGNVTSTTDARGTQTRALFDKYGRVTETQSRPNSGASWETTGTIEYDQAAYGLGRVSKTVTKSGGYNLTESVPEYNFKGQVIKATEKADATGDGVYDFVATGSASFDSLGRTINETLPDPDMGGSATAEILTPRYNATGALVKLTGTNTYLDGMRKNAQGAVEWTKLGNGIVSDLTYNINNFSLTRSRTGPLGGTALLDFSYTLDDGGNVIAMTDHYRNETHAYTYDAMNRLTADNISGGDSRSYTYDNIGNILTSVTNSNTINYTYPSAGSSRPHAATAMGANSYVYDASGNMTSRLQGSTYFCHTFDNNGRLKKVEKLASGTCISNPVVASTTEYVGGRVLRKEGTTTTLYLAGMEIKYVSGNWESTKVFYPAGGAMRIYGGTDPAPGLYYTHGDKLGSTSVMTDANGNEATAAGRPIYAPFGELRTGTLGNIVDFGYTGQTLDRNTGTNQGDALMYYGARYYLPDLKRFISADTIVPGAGTQELNRYSYVGNNPVNMIDPSGHYQICLDDFTGCSDMAKRKPAPPAPTHHGNAGGSALGGRTEVCLDGHCESVSGGSTPPQRPDEGTPNNPGGGEQRSERDRNPEPSSSGSRSDEWACHVDGICPEPPDCDGEDFYTTECGFDESLGHLPFDDDLYNQTNSQSIGAAIGAACAAGGSCAALLANCQISISNCYYALRILMYGGTPSIPNPMEAEEITGLTEQYRYRDLNGWGRMNDWDGDPDISSQLEGMPNSSYYVNMHELNHRYNIGTPMNDYENEVSSYTVQYDFLVENPDFINSIENPQLRSEAAHLLVEGPEAYVRRVYPLLSPDAPPKNAHPWLFPEAFQDWFDATGVWPEWDIDH